MLVLPVSGGVNAACQGPEGVPQGSILGPVYMQTTHQHLQEVQTAGSNGSGPRLDFQILSA